MKLIWYKKNTKFWSTYCHVNAVTFLAIAKRGVTSKAHNSIIAEFKLAITIDKNVGRFDVPVYEPHPSQVNERPEHGIRDFPIERRVQVLETHLFAHG